MNWIVNLMGFAVLIISFTRTDAGDQRALVIIGCICFSTSIILTAIKKKK